jgi:ribosome-associated toxin RatA of RatAB toxin-antitoxin module
MPQIKAYDETTIKTSVEDVWKVLVDIPRYPKWWPKVVNLKILKLTNELIGTEFEARPLGGKSFSCRVVSIVPKKEIKLNYFEGIYRGYGIWKLERKEKSVTVSYSVELEIIDNSIALLSRIISITKLHSMIFKRILNGLTQQVKLE